MQDKTIIDPATLLAAYASGLFPMADARDDVDVYWVEPTERAILPLEGFHLSRTLARTVRRDRFRVTTDTAFARTVAACAAPDTRRPESGRDETWINGLIERSYAHLFAIGHAHSVECWDGADLVGGLYGVSLGRAFFGESMFSRATDASKVALAHLVARLRIGGFTLLDCQFMTSHLQSLGAITMPQADYLTLLQRAVSPAVLGAAGAGAGAGAGAEGAAVWAALDALLPAAGAAAAGRAAAPAAGRAAPDAAPVSTAAGSSSGTSTSPGQLIVQLLTNTS